MSNTTPESRAHELLQHLTLAEKLAQLTCYFPRDINDTTDFTAAHPHGVGQVSTLEARMATDLEQVARFQRELQQRAMDASGHDIPAIFHMEGLCGAFLPGATSFPNGLARGASFDAELERSIGSIVGRQERAVGFTQTFAPVLDVTRDPRMGRQGEAYGEDPTLVASLGVAYTQGLQSVDEGGVRRTEGVAKHFLGSHHTEGGIHGAHCNVPSRLLREVYGKPFQAAISQAGLRGIMPSYNSINGEPVSASHHLLIELLRDEMGFDGVTVSDYCAITNLHAVQRVAATLPDAGQAALSAGLDVETQFTAAYGPELLARFESGEADVAILDRAVLHVLSAKFRMGLFEDPFAHIDSYLQAAFNVPADSDASLASARESLVLLSNRGVLPLARPEKVLVIGPHAATARYFFGGYTHFSMAEASLAVNSSMAGVTDGQTRTIEHTVPGTGVQADDEPAFEELLQAQQPGIRTLVDELADRLPGCEVDWVRGFPIAGADDSGHAEALEAAGDADVVILTLGGRHGTSSIATMGEGIDTTDINLPLAQDELIRKLANLDVPLVGVHLDGRPISSDAADEHLDAIIEAWSPAEHGAQAIVDVLFGAVNPSGKMPVSVARNAGQVPVYYNHPNGSAWHQGESIGFTDYVDQPHLPRYPFGHGLSYTSFQYLDITVDAREVTPDGMVRVSVRLRNSGHVDGTEVVQLYARDPYARMSRPVIELVGFQRVALTAGEEATVTFTVPASQLAFLDQSDRWLVEAGTIDFLAGGSSQDTPLSCEITITADAYVNGRTRGFFAATEVTR